MAVPTIESVEAVAKSWSRVDWDNLQIRLNEEVKAIGSRQDDGDEGKRQLIEESAAFRENSDKAIRKAAVPLIKAFQAEVDRLTLRSKAAESIVIDLCRVLIQVPDPSPYLEQLEPLLAKAKRLQSCEEEIAVVKSQLADLHLEYADLQNQELTVRKLREKVKHLELEAENNIQAALSNREKQLRAEFDVYKEEMATKQDELSAENKKLLSTMADLEVKNREMSRALDEAKSKLQQKETVEDEQLQIVSNDLENATHRAKEAEREVIRLREELAKFSDASNAISESDTSESALIRSKDNQIRKLLEENKNLSAKLAEVTTESRIRIGELTQELERHAEMLDRLETQLEAQSDYETIKKELRILKSVEFGEDAGWTADTDGGLTSSATATAEIQLGGRVKALEELLVDKSRRLQNDNVCLKMQNQQLSVGDTCGKSTTTLSCDALQPVVDALGLIVASGAHTNDTGIDWSHEQLDDMVKDSQTIDEVGVDAQRCAANLLNLLMCTASSSTTAAHTPDSVTSSADDEFGRNSSFNAHDAPRTPAEAKVVTELQARVAQNVRQLGSRPLNTMEIARQCKRLMVAYNIGQRLFAKFVMNQSQGSLSELLSKPRHWNKLTDKGREAFRRIYGWISDVKAIELLCSVSPRRIQPADETKIEAPPAESLWESGASMAPLSRYHAEPSGSSTDESTGKKNVKAPEEVYLPKLKGNMQNTSNTSTNATPRASSRWRHDDIPKEKIITIFQNELAKLREQEAHLEQAIASRPTCNATNTTAKLKDDKKSFTNSLKKLEEMAEMAPVPSSLSTLASAALSSSVSSCSSFSHAGSPLAQGNSLFAMKCKAGMSPITQEQLERYAILDTEELVRQIKEYLCANSISQRQFGEHVLGLSQGSVSDLLARPKPWSMLTQKGREPFIRMRLFLNEAATFTPDKTDICNEETISEVQLRCSETLSTSLSCHESESESKQAAVEGLLRMKHSAFEEELDEDAFEKKAEERGNDDRQGGGLRKAFDDTSGTISNGANGSLSNSKLWESSSPHSESYTKTNSWLKDLKGLDQIQKSTSTNSVADAVQSVLAAVAAAPISSKSSSHKRRSLSNTQTGIGPPKKAQRTVITEQQKEALKFVFEHEQHPSQRTVEQLSEKLSLTQRTVSNWFHNYRTRHKANLKEGKTQNGDTRLKRSSTKSTTDRWQQDLAELLELVSKPLPVNHWSPTMVTADPTTRKTTRNTTSEGRGNSQLDKAIARMQMIAAAKNA
uniref:DNA-binding protein SATB n=1 Tax=Parascaris univalens TaxID=6257 RepID=A0A915BT53_PARUN